MNKSIYFDDALPIFANLIQANWGASAIENNQFLRDVDGRITFITIEEFSSEERQKLSEKIIPEMGVYIDPEFPIATPDEIFDDRLKDLSESRKLEISHPIFAGIVNLVDRRLVGADWLRTPAVPVIGPTRIVFASIKGGVGRSTALCVLAAHLAENGKRVLTIDLDLEAPGLGNMLLDSDSLPQFGLLDYLVEQHLGELDEEFFSDLIGPSWLGGQKGRIDVVPALGHRSLTFPGNVLAKIARSYLTSAIPGENDVLGFSEKISRLLDKIATSNNYDFVLIDSRAGLHETAAAAFIGLGAEVLLFGIDQPQTLSGYEILFAHLATLPRLDDDWRDRLNIVHAKAAIDTSASANYIEKMRGLMQKYLWPELDTEEPEQNLAELEGEFETEWAEIFNSIDNMDNKISTISMTILDSQRFQNFDPLSNRGVLEEKVYSEIFGGFLSEIDKVIINDEH